MGNKILVVDDDVDFVSMLELLLPQKGYSFYSANNGPQCLRLAYDIHPDLILLDIMMPEMDGFETCRLLREMTETPVLMLTAKSSEGDVSLGFQVGADDYLRKPFCLAELLARINALLRRHNIESRTEVDNIYNDGTLMLDHQTHSVSLNGESICLSPREFKILTVLIANIGHVVTHREILCHVWGKPYENDRNLIPTYICYLRKKLNTDHHQYIRTEWGEGYWFCPSESKE
jgi:DNA-binding response OmpR family regulator